MVSKFEIYGKSAGHFYVLVHELSVRGYLAHKKQRRPRNLQWDCASGHMVALGGWAFSKERGTPVSGVGVKLGPVVALEKGGVSHERGTPAERGDAHSEQFTRKVAVPHATGVPRS